MQYNTAKNFLIQLSRKHSQIFENVLNENFLLFLFMFNDFASINDIDLFI